MRLDELGAIFNQLFNASPGNFRVKEPYVGLWEASIDWKHARGYLVSPGGDVVKMSNGSKPLSYKHLIILKSHILVIRTYAEKGHNYAVYTAASLRPTAPLILIEGWQPVPEGSRVMFLNRDTLLPMSPSEIQKEIEAHELKHTRVTRKEDDSLSKNMF